MSETQPDKVIQMAPVMELIHPDPEAIFSKRHTYPATAAIAEELKPYYDYAIHALDASSIKAEKRHAASVTSGRLPEALSKEVRAHLGELQSSAFLFEAHGDVNHAAEIRTVAHNLSGMLKIAQQFCKQEKPGQAQDRNA